MDYQETVAPEQEEVEFVGSIAGQPQEALIEEHEEAQHVPLHALQKERRKRQEIEQELKFLRQQQQLKAAEVDDESRYESATKEDLGKQQEATIRIIEERKWARDNPEKYQKINDELPEFLKLRPNLASAIEGSTNRYEEAWELMSKLNPKQQQAIQKPKPQAPGSPSGIPKAAAMSESVDLMSMSDSEFNSWRQQRRGRR